MDAELKAKWVAALRSGEYKQTTGYLEYADKGRFHDKQPGNCCLGVLCRVALVLVEVDHEHGINKFDGAGAMLTDRLLKKFGLSDSQQVELSKLNDTGETFDTIADYIEQVL